MPNEIYPFYLRHPVSAGLHLLCCLWALYASALLYRLAGRDPLRRWTMLIFGASMVLLYAASGTYHSIPADQPRLMEFCRLVDHSAIYLLIAGTYTPIFAILLQGRLRTNLLLLLWGLTALGIACKWLIPMPPYELTVAMYVALGWIGLLAAVPLIRTVGARPLGLALLGGILYTLGALVEAVRWPKPWPGIVGPHEILHLFDIGGTVVFVAFIMRRVLPYRPPSAVAVGAFAPRSLVQLAPPGSQ